MSIDYRLDQLDGEKIPAKMHINNERKKRDDV